MRRGYGTRHVAPCASHGVLAASLEGGALGRVIVWVLAVGLGDERADRCRPVHLVGALLRYGYHGRLERHRWYVFKSKTVMSAVCRCLHYQRPRTSTK